MENEEKEVFTAEEIKEQAYEEIIKDSNSDIVMFMYNSSGFDSMVKAMIDKGIK